MLTSLQEITSHGTLMVQANLKPIYSDNPYGLSLDFLRKSEHIQDFKLQQTNKMEVL
jgi:hypothetical protein